MCAWCGHPLAAPAELADGTWLGGGRYQVLRVIGRGGFGITYDAGDRRLQRRVAMKELFPESAVRHGSRVLTPPSGRAGFEAARERFLREARVLARFTHPGIVRVYEVFEEHGTAYLVMEPLEGRTLVDLLRERGRPFAEDEVLDVAGRVAAALRPIHAAGVLHRDVNPSNVMLTHHGRIVVIDFGLARDFDQGQTVGMTRVVTPGYAPLEQYRGTGRFGPSTDVYGLAATLYRLATGRVPVAALERDGGAALPSPRDHNPAISREVSDAILDGLELQPGHRPQDLDAFLARLGIRGLPEGPRSMLLDASLPPTSPPPSSASRPAVASPAAAPAPAVRPVVPDPPTAATEVVAPAVPPAPAAVAAPTERAGDPDATAAGGGLLDPTVPPAVGPPGGTVAVPPTRVAEPAATRRAGPADDPTPPRGLAPIVVPAPVAPAAPDAAGPPPSPEPARLPLAVGPHPPGRRRLTVPALLVVLALASAAPVLATAVLVLVVLPALATLGDSAAHRLRAAHGVAGGWAERRLAPGALVTPRFVRNVAASVLRAIPMLGVGVVLLAGWYGIDALGASRTLVDGALRLIGLLAAGVLAMAAREGTARFRTGAGIDHLVVRLVPGGRTTERLVVLWIVAAFLVAGALWLRPDPFPLP